MRQDTFISNLDDLQRWFEVNQTGKEARPYWTLWRGYESKADRIIARNVDIIDADKAWELLQEMIEAHADGGGSFRVYVTDKPLHNFGLTTLVRLPNPNQAGGTMPAGIHGTQVDVQSQIEKEVERRIEMYELKREIEELKSGNRAHLGAVDTIKEVLTEFPELRQLGYLLGVKMMGLGAAAEAAAVPAPAVAGSAAPDDAPQDGYDYDVLEPALDKLRDALGGDVETKLARLAKWASQNPEMARQTLQNLPTA